MFLVFWHMVLATVLTQIMARTTKMLPGVHEVSEIILYNVYLDVIFIFCIYFVLNREKLAQKQ